MKVFNNEIIDVACAIIVNKDITKVLAGKRTDVNLWEFPGGKLEDGETASQAIIREVKEELDVDFKIAMYLGSYVKDIDAKIYMLYVYIGGIDGEPKTNSHSELRWVSKSEIDQLDWIETEEMLDGAKWFLKDKEGE